MPTRYGQDFFEDQFVESSRSAAVVVPSIMSMVSPRSVVDVGCGIGCWAEQFLWHGASVVGVDGDWVDRTSLRIPETCFVSRDLTNGLRFKDRFDLAVCIEVAEHLPPTRACSLIKDLVDLAPCVLFSAAVPDQGGTGHLNEQPLPYWAAKFAAHGYQPADRIRPRIWDDERISWWFRQNLIFFAAPAHPILDNAPAGPLELYHPALVAFLRRRASQPGLRTCLTAIPGALREAIKTRVRRLTK
jgi:SAM-dependent methyltransferase